MDRTGTSGTQAEKPASASASSSDALNASSTSVTAAPTPASPLESAEAYENICGICFTEIHPVDNPRGRLNSCDHLFCGYCIKEWAKNTNVCPSCKARFTRIYTFRADTQQEEETKVRRRNYKAWELTYYDDDEDEEEEWEDSGTRTAEAQEQVVCAVCQQSHNAARMIFCDRRQCPYTAHLDCLGMADRPVTFLCSDCTELREKEAGHVRPSAESVPPPAPQPPTAAVVPSRAAQQTTTPAAAAARVARAAPTATARGRAAPAASQRTAAATAALRADPQRRTAVRPPPAPRALYGGSDSDSSSDSSSSDGRVPVSTRTASSSRAGAAPPAAVLRGPVDFSKPHLHLLPPAPQASRGGHRGVQQGSRNGSTAVRNAEGGGEAEDDYYFLLPTSHAVAATIDLERSKASRAAEAQTRRQRERARAERLETVFGVRRTDVHGGRKRPQGGGPAETVEAELEAAEKEFTDPQLRRAMEERMVRRWASDMLPVLRRRRYIDGDAVTTEADMWNEATEQARKMVREKLDAKGASLRRRREQLVQAQAKREAAALAKLARIIAQHRERDQQNHARA